MNATKEYVREIEQVFAEAAAEASRFPGGLREKARAFISRCNPLESGGGSNAIGFLLPYWLREWAGGSERTCRDMAVGNAFAMLHYFLLDDAMDESGRKEGTDADGDEPSIRERLALGQLFYARFRDRYGRHFPADSAVWERYRAYLEEWAEAVTEEGKRPADPRDFRRLAGKSAPVKLCAAGTLLAAGREGELGRIEEAVDLALAVLQLSDDWADWREDLEEASERCNAFLTLAREAAGWPEEEPLAERGVRRAVYRAGALDKLADIVQAYGERLKAIPDVPAKLVSFACEIHAGLSEDARRAERTTIELASGGGLSYYLSNNTKK